MNIVDYTMRGGEHPDKEINEVEIKIAQQALNSFMINKEFQSKGLKWAYNLTYFSMLYVPATPELRDFMQRKRPYPEFIEIEPTTFCNLKCKMCEHTYWKEPNKHMTYDKFLYILNQFPRLGWIGLTGIGEMFLNPDFMKMIEEVKKREIYLELFDNFCFLNKEKLTKLVEWGVDKIYISLDGATKETYEKNRIGSLWERVLSNLKTLDEIKKEKKTAFPYVWFHFIVNKDNIHEVIDYVDFVNSLNIDVKGIQYTKVLHDYPEIKDMYVEIPEELMYRAMERGQKLKIHTTFNVNTSHKKPPVKNCCTWSQPFIFVDGTVIPCCSLNEQNDRTWQRETSLGNVFKDDMRDIWYGKKYDTMIKSIRQGKLCKSCERCVLYENPNS